MKVKNYILGLIIEYIAMFFKGLRLLTYTMFGTLIIIYLKTYFSFFVIWTEIINVFKKREKISNYDDADPAFQSKLSISSMVIS